MKIVKLTAENYKRLSAVEITPEGNLVLITGKNEVGKSSVLDAITAALCGGRNLPKEPIKQGEHRASIVVDMGDYTVTRKFFGERTTLKVEQKGELTSKISRPQEFLDSIVGNISFDPLAFSKMQESEQRKLIMGFVGLDLRDLDKKIEEIKARRSEIRKEKDIAETFAMTIEYTPDMPNEEIKLDDLFAEKKSIEEFNTKANESNSHRTLLIQNYNNIANNAKETAAEIQRLTEKLKNQQIQCTEIKEELDRTPVTSLKNINEIESKIVSIGATNEKIKNNRDKKNYQKQVDTLAEEYSSLGQSIKDIEFEKAKRMTDAKMPIAGLTIAEDGLRFNNIPLSQVNDANKIKISVAIGMAMNPKLKVLRVNGNDLDTANLKALGEMVADKDYQIWVEKIDESGKLGFVIEDGTLTADKTAEEQK
ncbi:MAG: AAA family ATPase [Candidatus Bathyarchaeota archaeon]|jgi:chromosome segregation ATPase